MPSPQLTAYRKFRQRPLPVLKGDSGLITQGSVQCLQSVQEGMLKVKRSVLMTIPKIMFSDQEVIYSLLAWDKGTVSTKELANRKQPPLD